MAKQLYTPHQVSRALGVSESTLKRWCDKGVLATIRTAGGHRRVAFDEVVRFLRDSGQDVVEPEVLGLPAAVGHGATVLNRARREFLEALTSGNSAVATRIILDLYITRHPVWQIGDEVVGPALSDVGLAWQCGNLSAFQERWGCEIVQRCLYVLDAAVPEPPADAPRAVGGTLEGDHYRLATTLCEAVLREAGWQAQSFGTSLPQPSLIDAVRKIRPRLCWLSVSHVADADRFVAELNELFDAAKAGGTALVVGGRGFSEELRRRCRYTTYCERLKDLHAFAESISKLQPRSDAGATSSNIASSGGQK